MKLKKTGMFWLRTATMAHHGFNPGAPWNVNPDYFHELEKAGFVERHYDVDENTGREYLYAVATAKGFAVIRDHATRVSG